jgi:periplasmic protein CpxP/Spy
MKFNPLKLVLIGSLLSGALLLLPKLSQAQENRQFPVLEQLDLTTDQETQLSTIRRNTRSQLERIVSAEQQEIFKTKMTQGATLRESIAAMNLSADQRTQVRETLQAARQEAATVLTADQRQVIRAVIQERLGDRPQAQ